MAIPTETVYGLAADADNEAAVRAMFSAKGRPADHPVIVHIDDAQALHEWAIDVPDCGNRAGARLLAGAADAGAKAQCSGLRRHHRRPGHGGSASAVAPLDARSLA